MSTSWKTKRTEKKTATLSLSLATKLIVLIYFFSGACALIDEVVWVRLLKLTLGNTVYASSIVVSTFMGGLALGAYIMSFYADNVTKRLRLYAILELFAALAALLFPFMLKLMDVAYRSFYVHFDPSAQVLMIVQVVVSAFLLLVPAMIMGSTLPLVGRYVTGISEQMGRLVGRLYAVNTLGAALGCFLAGFILIRLTGVMGTIYIAAFLNLLVAAASWILSRKFENSETAGKEKAEKKKANSSIRGTLASNAWLLLLAFFFSGLISIGYEILWMRSIVFIFGGATYIFSAVLTIYLAGNVIGASIGSGLSQRIKNPAVGFGISLACLGILGIFYVSWLNFWRSEVLIPIIPRIVEFWKDPVSRILFYPILNCFFLFIIPSIVMGIGFPLALQAWSHFKKDVGFTTGIVYSVNTIGAVLGGLLVGFLFVPSMGVQHSVILLGLAGIWMGCVLLIRSVNNLNKWLKYTAMTCAVVLTFMAYRVPSDLFKRQFVNFHKQYIKTIAIEEGLNTTVSVHQGMYGELTLATAGMQVAGDHRGFRVTQKTLGHLGILMNKNTRRTLTVGFGSGETSCCMAKHDIEKVEIIEIAPELVEMSLGYFSHINLGKEMKNNKKVHVTYMDAKNYLHLSDEKYDVIVTDAINPKLIAENASLYTKEYFESASKRLNEGGILGCWLPMQEMPISCINSILGTFGEVFPYVTVWFTLTAPARYDFLYLAGSNDPQTYSPVYMQQQLDNEAVMQSAEYLSFLNPHYILSCYIGDEKGLNKYLSEYETNSDYTPFIEFNTDFTEHDTIKDQWLVDFITTLHTGMISDKIEWENMSGVNKAQWLQEQKRYDDVAGYLYKIRNEKNPIKILYECNQARNTVPNHVTLKGIYESTLNNIKDIIQDDPAGVDSILKYTNLILKQEDSLGIFWLVQSMAQMQNDNILAAMTSAENAVKYLPANTEAGCNLGAVYLRLRQMDKAINILEDVVRKVPGNIVYISKLAQAYYLNNQYEKAASCYNNILKIDPSNYLACFNLGELYNKQGKTAPAIENYQKTLEIQPDFALAKKRLEGLRVNR